MALFLKEAPGCYLFVGGKNAKKGFDAPHHNAHFNGDEGCLPVGLALMAGGGGGSVGVAEEVAHSVHN